MRMTGETLRYHLLILASIVLSTALASAQESGPARVRIAVASFRERVRHPQIYVYEHDGVATGRVVGGVPAIDKRSDHHPALSADGRVCMFCSEQEGQSSLILGWDLERNAAIELPQIHAGDNVHMAPSLTADGEFIAWESWRRPGSPGRWDLLMYDRRQMAIVNLSGVCTTRFDERKPALSGNGTWLAYTTNANEGNGQTDIRLLHRSGGGLDLLPTMNSAGMDTEPSLSGDGGLLAFISDRSGGEGNRDVWLFDLRERQFVPLPGLNAPGQEQSPCLSADGRWVAFVSERLDSAGERDVYLYDREEARLVPLPGLNSHRDEYDPFIVAVSPPTAATP